MTQLRDLIEEWQNAAQTYRDHMTAARKAMYSGASQYGVAGAALPTNDSYVTQTLKAKELIGRALEALQIAEDLRKRVIAREREILRASEERDQPAEPPSKAGPVSQNLQPSAQGALLAPEQVAAELGVSVKTLAIWRSAQRYDLPYIKVGRLVRYDRIALHAFLDRRSR